eukprot:1140143-Alexandrium_andersonii.AAC.1
MPRAPRTPPRSQRPSAGPQPVRFRNTMKKGFVRVQDVAVQAGEPQVADAVLDRAVAKAHRTMYVPVLISRFSQASRVVEHLGYQSDNVTVITRGSLEANRELSNQRHSFRGSGSVDDNVVAFRRSSGKLGLRRGFNHVRKLEQSDNITLMFSKLGLLQLRSGSSRCLKRLKRWR